METKAKTKGKVKKGSVALIITIRVPISVRISKDEFGQEHFNDWKLFKSNIRTEGVLMPRIMEEWETSDRNEWSDTFVEGEEIIIN